MAHDSDQSNQSPNLPEYFSTVRHSVKNHMSVIIAFAQLLRVESQKKTQQKNQELMGAHLDKIEQRAKKVVEEIDQLLSEGAAKKL